MSPGPTLTDLPVELVEKVLMLVDWRVVLQCKTLCKALDTLIKNSPLLRYQIELGVDGLVDSPLSKLSVSQRFQMLLQRRERWRELKWKERVLVPSDNGYATYDFVGGVLGKLIPTSEAREPTGLGNNSLGLNGHQESGDKTKITFTYLPSFTNDEDVKVLTHEDVGIDCCEFAIDPAQDLLVLIQEPCRTYDGDTEEHKLTIHLRTISTNKNHPKAPISALSERLPYAYTAVTVQICDDILAVVVYSRSSPHIFIWQWTTGRLLVGEMDIPTFRHMDDFSLISSRAFIVTILHPSGAIKVYPFKAPGDTQWTLDRVVAPLPPPNQAFASLDSPVCMEPRRCAILSFPSLTPSTVYSEISSDTAPFTTSHDAGKLFHTSEDVRVHLMSVRTKPQRRMNTIPYNWQSGKMISSYTVIVANRILLEQAERARSVFKGEELHVRWDEWGPQNTRWLSGPYDRAWLRFVHGSRFVCSKSTCHLQGRVQVLDFNVYPKRLLEEMTPNYPSKGPLKVATGERSMMRLEQEPTSVYEPMIFSAEVLSYLPFTESTSREEYPYTEFMIDDERIVCLSESETECVVFTF